MELRAHHIIRGPVISDKAYKLNNKLGVLVLNVDPKATAPQISDAVETLFSVKVSCVRTAVRRYQPPRSRSQKKRGGGGQETIKRAKIAYVSLKEGYKVSPFEQMGATQAAAAPTGAKAKLNATKDGNK